MRSIQLGDVTTVLGNLDDVDAPLTSLGIPLGGWVVDSKTRLVKLNLKTLERSEQTDLCKSSYDAVGQTALHMACASGALPLVSALLKAGADPNICDRTGASCVAMASSAGHAHVLQKLPGPSFGQKKSSADWFFHKFSILDLLAVFHASGRSN